MITVWEQAVRHNADDLAVRLGRGFPALILAEGRVAGRNCLPIYWRRCTTPTLRFTNQQSAPAVSCAAANLCLALALYR